MAGLDPTVPRAAAVGVHWGGARHPHPCLHPHPFLHPHPCLHPHSFLHPHPCVSSCLHSCQSASPSLPAPPALLASLSLSSSPSVCISIPLCTPIHSCISIPSYVPTPACLPIPHSRGAVMLQVGQWAAVLGDRGWLQHLPRGALLHLSLVALALGRAHPSLTPLGSMVPGEGAKAASPWPRLQSPDSPHCTNDAQIGA